MIISNNSNTSFGTKISPTLMYKLELQASSCPGSIRKKFNMQKKNIEKWGNPKDELVIGKNMRGKDCLALRSVIPPNLLGQWFFERTSGRTLLSHFLRLTQKDITETGDRIILIYKKYGYGMVKARN